MTLDPNETVEGFRPIIDEFDVDYESCQNCDADGAPDGKDCCGMCLAADRKDGCSVIFKRIQPTEQENSTLTSPVLKSKDRRQYNPDGTNDPQEKLAMLAESPVTYTLDSKHATITITIAPKVEAQCD